MRSQYKQFNEVSPSQIGIRNRIRLFYGLDRSNYFTALLGVSQKSRIVQNDVEKFERIAEKLALFCDQHFDRKVLMIAAPLCSKARVKLLSLGWELIENAAV